MESFKYKTKIYFIAITIILVIGILIRIVGIAEMPNALNCDEASSGYEAYSIMKYGIDRTGNKLPVFLESWGGGQNALFTYLMIPFIALLGLNTLSIRLPMAILGCISLIIMYLLLKKIGNKKLTIIGLTFFAICPWHIMKSRWGLESNLFPDLVLIFVYLLITGIENKNKILYYLSFVIAGLTAYSYRNIILFLTSIFNTIINLISKKTKNNNKTSNYFNNNSWNSIIPNSFICNHKYAKIATNKFAIYDNT